MSTSTDGVVLRGLPLGAVTAADTSTDLRGGVWTRFGGDGVRGDEATEATLRGLAAQSREAARAQGFAAGWAEGRRGSVARTEEAHEAQVLAFDQQGRRVLAAQQSAADALGRAVLAFEQVAAARTAELTAQAVDLALEIAEAVLGRELAALDDVAAEAVRRAAQVAPVDVPLTVRLHPQDLADLDEQAVSESTLRDRSVTWVADAGVARGDALVETGTGVVDAGIGTALQRVRGVLGR